MEENLIIGETGLPVAKELAEMLLIRNDLRMSLASLTIWVEQYPQDGTLADERARAIHGSLFRDGITQFVGCFDSKNAYPLVVETVYPNLEGIAPYFRWLRDLRNSYTAHRHGSARQCCVGAVVQPGTGKYMGRTEFFAAYAGPNKEGHADLLSVVDMALNHVDGRITQLQQQFESEASAIPPEELLRLPPAAIQPQDPRQMAKSRGNIRKGLAREYGESPAQPPHPDTTRAQ